ncbi:MAG: inorganic triphosphatase, partial [Burkholderiales bacterium]|nr:inorganic triphosphatase [Burkholderiales bacterium]
MTQHVEIELKFLVPAQARAAVAAQVGRETASSGHVRLLALYLDTPDRRLARAGLAWRLRREGRRWVQTLKGPGAGPLERFEHEVLRPGPEPDAALHAGTAAGDRLIELLRRAGKDGDPVQVRYRTEVRRRLRRVRTRGAVVEVAFDEGRIVAAAPGATGAVLPLCELEFELVSGSTAAMLGLVQRWCRRFGLIVDPRSKAERGDELAEGRRVPLVRKAEEIAYPRDADAVQAFSAVLDECRDQILRNAIALVVGDAALRAEHVHQLRVGIRRLRSALRAFRGFVAPPPDALVQGLRALFAQLGQARDQDVLAGGVAAELVQAGAPRLPTTPQTTDDEVDVLAMVCAPDTQALLLQWMAWPAS